MTPPSVLHDLWTLSAVKPFGTTVKMEAKVGVEVPKLFYMVLVVLRWLKCGVESQCRTEGALFGGTQILNFQNFGFLPRF
jgi:hypothetical protein